MKIPSFWAKGTHEAKDLKGRNTLFECWRWSYNNFEEAKRLATEAAKNIADKFINHQRLDRYAYFDRPIREEIIKEITNNNDAPTAIITRNNYGALVLNTARVMFIDVDDKPAGILDGLKKLIGIKVTDIAYEGIKSFAANNHQWGLRIYRTNNGYRVLITHDLFDPKNEETIRVLNQFGSDELYVRLCRVQECFRARLTPKPWRCNLKKRHIKFPRENPDQEIEHQEWLKQYNSRITEYATCKLVNSLGNKQIHPDIIPFMKVHDEVCRVNESKPLA